MKKRRNVILLIAAAMVISIMSCDMGTMDQDDQDFDVNNVIERVELEDGGYVEFISPEPGIVFVSCVLGKGASVPQIGNVLDYYKALTGEEPSDALVAAVGSVSEDEENIGGDSSIIDTINSSSSYHYEVGDLSGKTFRKYFLYNSTWYGVYPQEHFTDRSENYCKIDGSCKRMISYLHVRGDSGRRTSIDHSIRYRRKSGGWRQGPITTSVREGYLSYLYMSSSKNIKMKIEAKDVISRDRYHIVTFWR